MSLSSAAGSSAARAGTIDLGLARITSLLSALGRPELGFAIIHVAGTNAKGSTTAYLDALLCRTTGTRTGRFNSPHLVHERDACRVNGAAIGEAIWEEAGRRVRAADAEQKLACTPFELLTARAFLSFSLLPAHERPEVLLIEVGLGGLLDATNVFDAAHVLASVVCPVDLDHQNLLGDTLAAIAAQKAGIVRQGGLCVIADQRRAALEQEEGTEPDGTALRHLDTERRQSGEAAEIYEAIRRTALAANARVCKAYVPWAVLSSPPLSSNPRTPWATTVSVHARHTPLLYASSSTSPSFSGTFSSRTGDGVLPGPTLQLPRTRAALSGACTALQTLWAIARDETPGGLGRDGADEHEELRLRIAWALREDADAKAAVQEAVRQTRWEGRADWCDVPLSTPSTTQQVAVDADGDADMQASADEPGAPTAVIEQASLPAPAAHPPATLHILTDGAHNVSACFALRKYIDDCVAARFPSSPSSPSPSSSSSTTSAPTTVTITHLLSFSSGKDVAAMLSALFASSLSAQLARASLATSAVRIKHRIGLLKFSTPVEGMPWVHPLDPTEAEEALSKLELRETDVRVFPSETLGEALEWAAQAWDGKSVLSATREASQVGPGEAGGEGGEEQASMCVVAGSLYLVADLYRLLQARNGA